MAKAQVHLDRKVAVIHHKISRPAGNLTIEDRKQQLLLNAAAPQDKVPVRSNKEEIIQPAVSSPRLKENPISEPKRSIELRRRDHPHAEDALPY